MISGVLPLRAFSSSKSIEDLLLFYFILRNKLVKHFYLSFSFFPSPRQTNKQTKNRDIIFSPEVSASLSSAAQQKRMGEAKVIGARAEVDAARLMRQAADILASPAAMQIRQLEAFQTMAKTSNSKVIFIPMALQSDVAQLAAGTGEGEGSSSGGGGGGNALTKTYSAGMINSLTQM